MEFGHKLLESVGDGPKVAWLMEGAGRIEALGAWVGESDDRRRIEIVKRKTLQH